MRGRTCYWIDISLVIVMVVGLSGDERVAQGKLLRDSIAATTSNDIPYCIRSTSLQLI